jgi:hypothetical protein
MAETELDRFFRENRLREAQSVEPSVFENPQYASMIYNSSVPLNQLEKNIQQSQGATLEPYNPSLTDYFKSGASYVGENLLGMNNYQANKFGRQMFGDRGSDQLTKNIGFADIVPAFRGMHMAALPMIPAYANEAYRAFDRGDYLGGVIEGGAALLEGVLLTKPIAKSLKELSKSLSQKLKGEGEVSAPTIGALPLKTEPKMLASTRRMPPGGGNVMTDPRKLDELGFFYKSEEVANKMKQNKGSGADFRKYFENQGVTEAELIDTGLDDLFNVTSRPITKKDILTHINVNKLQLYEDVYQDNPITEGSTLIFEDISKKISETPTYNKYSNYEIDDLNKGLNVSDETRSATELTNPTKVLEDTKTGYRIVYDDEGQNFLTFDKDADIFDITQSEQYKTLADPYYREDMDAFRFDEIAGKGNINEAIVQTESYAIQNGDYVAKDARFSESTQPGGTNYREFVIGKQSNNPTLAQRGEYDLVDDYQNPIHFPNYNPIVHLRTKDRTLEDGSKTLYVEEFQSDRGQAGREKGFAPGTRAYEKNKQKFDEVDDELFELRKLKIKLTAPEQELLYQIKNPGRPPIRVPLREDVSGLMAEKYNQGAKIPDNVFDYENSRMPDEYKTMTMTDYIDFVNSNNLEDSLTTSLEPLKALRKAGFVVEPFEKMPKELQRDIVGTFVRYTPPTKYDLRGNNQLPDAKTFEDYADDLIARRYKLDTKLSGNIPGGDVVETTEGWTKFGIKRLLQRAVLEGHDSVSFSPGEIQVDRWRKESLRGHYDKKIPSMAKKVAGEKNVSKQIVEIRPKNLHTVVMLRGSSPLDRVYQVKEVGTDLPVASFKTLEEAQANADFRNATQKQESWTIKITPELREKVLKGLSLFTMGAGTAIGLEEQLGALSNMPSTQANAT